MDNQGWPAALTKELLTNGAGEPPRGSVLAEELRGAGRFLVEQIEKGELTDLFDHQFINNKAFIEFKKLLEQA